jgi:hypothetical protein
MSPIRETERQRYPADWPAIRARILRRADGRCEFPLANGQRCNAPDLTLVYRSLTNLEDYVVVQSGDTCPDGSYAIKVVLTVAHLNHEPEDCSDENLKAGCQLHHLRHDKAEHRKNASVTRRSQKNNGELFAEKGPA